MIGNCEINFSKILNCAMPPFNTYTSFRSLRMRINVGWIMNHFPLMSRHTHYILWTRNFNCSAFCARCTLENANEGQCDCRYCSLQTTMVTGTLQYNYRAVITNYQVTIGIQKAINDYQTHELLARLCIETMNPDITYVWVTPLLTNMLRCNLVNKMLWLRILRGSKTMNAFGSDEES